VSRHAGDRIPPPLRFELGQPGAGGDIAQAAILATVDENGAPRVALLAKQEIVVAGERDIRIALDASSATCMNLAARPHASLWCVLDGAAYTLQMAVENDRSEADERRAFVFTVTAVWCDFRPDSPLAAGPTYKVPGES